MKIAEIIINTGVKSLDKVFHYTVDDNISILPGARVTVPFGNGNRETIGYFMGFTDNSPFENLKPIKKVIDKVPLVSNQGLELAKHITKTTFCTFSEAIKLLMPPAVNFRFERIVILNNIFPEKLPPAQRKLLDTLKAAGGRAEQNKLLHSCGVKSSSVITALEKKGLVKVIESTVGGNKEKVRKKVKLTEEFEIKLQNYKPGPAMEKAINLLISYGSMYLSELTEYSGCSSASVISLEKRGIVAVYNEIVYRSPIVNNFEKRAHFKPNNQQKKAIDVLCSAVDEDCASEHLLYGVTGSGKTEVFLQVADYCIKKGKNVIILVPEISLTPQMTKRFMERFGDMVAVLHSGLSLGERYDQWQKINNGSVKVALGARSAIFAPFKNIGLIVIDEEHETTYKSENSPRYDARDIAYFRAKQNKCPVLYASATPRIADFYRAKRGEINLIKLDSRINNKLPEIKIVDMAKELASGNRSVYSVAAMEKLSENISAGKQSIVFLNRRGFSTFVSCRSCGYVVKCPQCSVSLTYHAKGDKLKCHLCDFTTDNLNVCPECGSKYIKHFGCGTQKAEQTLIDTFKEAEIIRMDGDTTSHKFSHERLLSEFGSKKSSILLGTQMITKGLDFPNVTLCVVLAADTLLNTGEYNSSEQAFSRLVQVCGRAGRGVEPGLAIVQTYEPKNKIFSYVINNDYEGFYEDEIKARRLMDYPPFGEIVSIVITGDDEEKTGNYGMKIEQELKKLLDKNDGLCKAFFGLAPCSVSKIKNKYRFRVLLKVEKNDALFDILKKLNDMHLESKAPYGLEIDISPTQNF